MDICGNAIGYMGIHGYPRQSKDASGYACMHVTGFAYIPMDIHVASTDIDGSSVNHPWASLGQCAIVAQSLESILVGVVLWMFLGHFGISLRLR